MMQSTQGSLVIVGANTPECQVFWNGQLVENVGVNVANDVMGSRVVIKVKEDPILAEMQEAGIVVRRV
jgi:hypothetical protein